MTYIIPSQSTKQLRQFNKGELLGEIAVSRNVNLDQPGIVELSPPMVAFHSKEIDADFDTCDVQGVTDEGLWGISGNLFVATGIGGASQVVTDRSGDTNAPAGNVEEDFTYFNTAEVASAGTGIKYKSAATTWTTVALSLSASYPTALALLDTQNGLMVGNKNLVKLINTSWAVAVTLTLPESYYVTSLCSNGRTAYIGTRHIADGIARLFTWDGVATAADDSFPCGSFEISSVKPLGSSAVIVTAHGLVQRFNGGGFDIIGQLPPYLRQEEYADAVNDYSRLSNRGVAVDGDVAYLGVCPAYEASFRYRADFPGGLWCLDQQGAQLYHKHGPSRTTLRILGAVATTDVNTTTDVITTGTAPETGDQLVYLTASSTAIGGLRDYGRYYAIKVSGTTFKLALTRDLATAGTAIDLTGTGNSSQNFLVYAVKDFGWSVMDPRMSVAVITSDLGSYTAGRYTLAADIYKTSAGSRVDTTVWNVPALLAENRGWVRYSRMNSYEVTDGFPVCSIKYAPLRSGESIVVKRRSFERSGMPNAIPQGPTAFTRGVWTSATVFTTTRDLSQVADGDEVEIVSGSGAGQTAHVSGTPVLASGTYTVTLDESILGVTASDDMDFVIDNFVKVFTITSTTAEAGAYLDATSGIAAFPITVDGKFLDLKVELRGVRVRIEEVQVGNQTLMPLMAPVVPTA